MPTSGPNFPSTGADDASIGAIAWTSPGNITSSNNVYASDTSVGQSHYLKATGFGFAIPAGSHIRGIKVEWEVVGGSTNFTIVKLLKNNVVSGNDKSSQGSIGTEAFVPFGGDGDTWGLTGLTAADINNANWGAVMSITNDTLKESHGSCSVDSVRMTIYYDPPDHGFFLRILGQ